MTDEEKQYWNDALAKINDKMELIIDDNRAIRSDLDTLRGYMGAFITDNMTLGSRVTRLEKQVRRLRKH